MSQVDIDSMHSLLAELDDKVDDHLSLILWAISVKSKACILLSDDSLGTSLDRVPVNGLGHLTEGSGGQDGKLLDHLGSGDGGEILDVEMPHNQAQGTGEMESMLNSTLDHNSPTGSSDVMYPPNPNVCCVTIALLYQLTHQISRGATAASKSVLIAPVVVQEDAVNDVGMIRRGVNFKVSIISLQLLGIPMT
jgi:hypothetical protein